MIVTDGMDNFPRVMYSGWPLLRNSDGDTSNSGDEDEDASPEPSGMRNVIKTHMRWCSVGVCGSHDAPCPLCVYRFWCMYAFHVVVVYVGVRIGEVTICSGE